MEIQHARILDAMVRVVCERGYAGASVSCVSARAKVSRRTFYEVFNSREDCFLAVLDEGHRQASAVISRAFEREQFWLDGVRAALAELLSLFDAEPQLARVWLVESLAAGRWALERRERNISSITSLIVGYWCVPAGCRVAPLVTAGVMASLHGVLQTHLASGREEPLIMLLGPCMGLVSAPYLKPSLVAREIERGEDVARMVYAELRGTQHASESEVQSVLVPGVLRDPRAHRARRCLFYLVEHPGASNRQVALAIGIARDSHISTLLARLDRAGVLVKRSRRPGGPNAWSPSEYGLQVAHALYASNIETPNDLCVKS